MTNTNIWDPKAYDFQHGFVAQYGKELIEYIDPNRNQKILDVGCGTGDLTFSIAESGADVTGIDSSIQMLEEARIKYPKLKLHCQSVLDMDYQKEFDSVFSNATLHWVLDPQKAAHNIYRSLKKDGKFVSEFGGFGNIYNIQSVLTNVLYNLGHEENSNRKIWYFPTIGQYCSILDDCGFDVSYAILYNRPIILSSEQGMENWIRQFAFGYLDNLSEEQIQEVIDVCLNGAMKRGYRSMLKQTNYMNGVWTADYVRLRVVAHKLKY